MANGDIITDDFKYLIYFCFLFFALPPMQLTNGPAAPVGTDCRAVR